MFRRSWCGLPAADANHPAHSRTGRAGNRAALLHPFDGVWAGPGVQRVDTLAEAVVFPSAADPTESRFRSSEPGNAPGGRWVAGRRYQAGHALEGMTRDHLNGLRGTRCKEVATR
jgi:hypothetical protein